jgi:hypothetical protein
MTSLPFIFSGCQSCTLLWIQGDPTSKMGWVDAWLSSSRARARCLLQKIC